MKKFLVVFLFLASFLFANEFVNKESSAFGTPINKQTTSPVKSYVGTKNLYLSYINYPKHIYKNQRFEIEVKALITRKNYDYIQTRFLNGKNMIPLNPKEKWKKSTNTKNTYTNKFYFKSYESKFQMPTIEVRLYKGKTLMEARRISGLNVTFSEIAKSDERFTNVIAKDFKIVTSKTKQYTNKEALTIIDIVSNHSNLEDFYIKGFKEQGITVIEDNYPNQHVIYYIVIPIHKKSIIFNYYNTTDNKFEKIILPITLEEELVSTQTDLNPNNSSFEFYKKIAVGVLAIILLILFVWKRKYIFLVLFLIVAIVFMLFAMPNKTIRLKENSVIYILPTKNSTIFQKTKKEIVVEDMKRKNDFVKIMIGSGDNKFIGWVKEKDVIKN
ncbi:hypothetical protein [Arcobacter sp. LA11]|uniref:hypothetical protein n=1 Tax=Arcobacter sp. LA11 TaxID=1898176 RepID=UPI0009323E67|nr:hypothetical protein [Arcobacter sp. LA11]